MSKQTVQRNIWSTDWGRQPSRQRLKPLGSENNNQNGQKFCQNLRNFGLTDLNARGERPHANILFTEESGGEYSYNHVDRVRITQNSSTPPGCPIPRSRRRPTIANHLDLATTNAANKYYPHLQYNQRRADNNSNKNNNNKASNKNHLNLQDYYSHVQSSEEVPSQYEEEHYYESYADNYHHEDNYTYLKESSGNDVCSLRRTRSLAVIREETYNDLEISSARNSRRSQLIPRAKLVNRSLIKERYNRSKRHKREEDNSAAGSGVETQTSETRESDDYYSNLKRLDSVQIFRPAWHNEKSDLDSINSDYFKNSQHQTDQPKDAASPTFLANSGDSHFEVLQLALQQESSSALPETTTSNSEQSDCSLPGQEGYSRNCPESDDLHSSDRTLTWKRDKNGATQPVISYDSVYLSSEDSSGSTLLRNLVTNKVSDSPDTRSLAKISLDADETTDRLYTKVSKGQNHSAKPRILAATTKRGVLEHLTSISTSQLLKTNDVGVIDSYRPTLLENHYCSLPDINIGRSLKVCERIDAKLRSSYRHYLDQNQDNQSFEDFTLGSPSIRRTKRARQREFSEIDSLASANISLISIDDSIISYSSNHEDSSLVEAEKQQSEIEILEDTLPSAKNHNQVTTDENKDPQESNSHELTFNTSQSTDFLLNRKTLNFPGKFQIIVTDHQDNIIEEDSIDSSIDRALERTDNNNNSSEWNFNEIINNSNDKAHDEKSSDSKGPIDIHRHSLEHQDKEKSLNKRKNERRKENENSAQTTCCPTKGILKKDSRREGRAEIHFPPPPSTAYGPLPVPNDSLLGIFKAPSTSTDSNDEKVTPRNFPTSKMSRPQILHVVDSKRHNSDSKDDENESVEKEFLQRVDSVRCYWSKITKNEITGNEATNGTNSNTNNTERNYVQSLEDEVDSSKSEPITMSYLKSALKPGAMKFAEHGLESFSPTVEIIELNGEKQATIVKARDVDEVDFDHVRYKVMKPIQFQKDILNRSKKEAQFDGLIQYLQDYSFQELLSNNNIVIIEPVRTKIEKPAETAAKLEPLNCKITGGSGVDTKSNPSKRHFFYQPVRVNRELLEEELPNPDTVRNVRRFFEEHVLQKQSSDTSYGHGGLRKWDSASLSSGVSSGDLSSPCDCNEDQQQHQHHHHHSEHHQHNGRGKVRRDGGAHEDDDDEGQDIFTSEENLCDDDMCGGESYYVSEDVLEKIRECGSTVTYYGGRVLNNKSPELSPMTRAIMQEIHGKDITTRGDKSMSTTKISRVSLSNGKRTCNTCQPNNCPQQQQQQVDADVADDDEIERKFQDNKHLGIQFKLVKSNSCSSRLELVGTDKCCQTRSSQASASGTIRTPSPSCNPEESVRELVNRLESGTIKNSSAPRIIESKCIEKTYRRSLPQQSSVSVCNGITINNHHIDTKEYLGLVDIINHVTVNNHLAFNTAVNSTNGEKTTQPPPSPSTKIPRNKNVDLAFNMSRSAQTAKTTPTTNQSTPSASNINSGSHSEKSINSDTNSNQSNNNGAVESEPHQNNVTATKILKFTGHDSKIALAEDTSRNNNDILSDRQKHVDSTTKTPNGCEPTVSMKKLSSSDQTGLMSPTLGVAPIKLLEKHYVANDKRLIEQRKYDEIEFEEFEVYSPEMAYLAGKSNKDEVNNSEGNANAIHAEQLNGSHPPSTADIIESFEERI